jgi:hypothetical protein
MKRPSDEALDRAAQTYVDGHARQDARTPREAAEAAHVPGGPSIDELEARIRAARGLPAKHRRTA